MTYRGNGYFESERGCFNSSLIYWVFGDEYVEIARTDYDSVIGYKEYRSQHGSEIEEFADDYGYEIEWR